MSEQKSAKLSIEEKTIYWEPFIGDLSRNLRIWGQRRQRKRRWQSEFAFFQSSSRLLQVTNFVKCRWTLQKLKSYEPYPSSEREGKLRRRLRSSSVKREKRHFHVVVVKTARLSERSCRVERELGPQRSQLTFGSEAAQTSRTIGPCAAKNRRYTPTIIGIYFVWKAIMWEDKEVIWFGVTLF